MSEIIENPFGAPVESNKRKLKKFLFALSGELGLYNPYKSDDMVRSYNYCKEELGTDFDKYLETVRRYIGRQEASREEGHVAINVLTDIFTKFPQIIAQLKREGHWSDYPMPSGWSVDPQLELPVHSGYRHISMDAKGGITYVHKDVEDSLPPLYVVYNKKKKAIISITNLLTGELEWKASASNKPKGK